jgi:putative SOS response-associated peptidase YedK
LNIYAYNLLLVCHLCIVFSFSDEKNNFYLPTMSDRFVLHASKEEIEALFKVSSQRDDYFEPDYNITPASLHSIVLTNEEGERQFQQARWGLIPPDAERERAGNEHHAIPAEEVLKQEWTAECVNQRRCLIPANGFYKWKTSERAETPFYIRLLSNRLTAFAGIYDVWESSSGRTVYSFAMLTTGANPLVEPVDDRMPVLLQPENFGRWLGSDDLTKEMRDELLLEPYELTEMAVNRVSEEVNDIHNNHPELIQPIPK